VVMMAPSCLGRLLHRMVPSSGFGVGHWNSALQKEKAGLKSGLYKTTRET
jgi:hypothetical protein